MKTPFTLLSICICMILILSQCTKPSKKCTIKGTVHGLDSKSIVIVEIGKDLRFDAIEIPIENGTFLFDTIIKNPVSYRLFLGEVLQRGGGRYHPFFMEPGTVFIDVFPEKEFEKNRVKGGKLNDELIAFNDDKEKTFKPKFQPINDSMSVLFKNGNYSSDTMNVIRAKLKEAKTQDEKIVIYDKMEKLRKAGLDLSPEAKKLKAKSDEVRKEQSEWQKKYINENVSLVSYDLLLKNMLNLNEYFDAIFFQNAFQKLSKKYPNHPYTSMVGNLVSSQVNIKVGGKYIDFSASDLEGNLHTLSEKIEGKFALIDFWATWCGPCIATSRTMVPVYREFKQKGFTIVGIAGEFKNTEKLVKRLEIEKFPWLNLVELDRQNNLWDKYGISNSGGQTFLVDTDGTILAIHPTAEEVKEILIKKMK